MAIQLDRTGWAPLFVQMRQPTGFFSRFFTVKPGNIYRGKKVAVDIVRNGESIAVAITPGAGSNMNSLDTFTTKEFEPPAFSESFPLDVNELLNRMAGVDPFSAAYTDYAGQMVAKMANGFTQMTDKIERAIEHQAASVLQTGTYTSIDATGATKYTISYSPKTAHFPTTGVSWTAGSPTPIADLNALAKVIRGNGKVNPNMLLMGDVAVEAFLSNTEVKSRLDNTRMNVGEINPRFDGSGATYQGAVWIGNYRFEIWTYPEMYEHPQTSAMTPYLAADKVVMLSDQTRLDRLSAEVPLPLGPDPRVAGLLPGRVSSREGNFDITPNVYPTANGKQIMGEVETRTLMAPIQIDGFGCLDVVI